MIYFIGSGFVRFQTSEAADACLQKSDDDKVKKSFFKIASTMTFFQKIQNVGKFSILLQFFLQPFIQKLFFSIWINSIL